MPTVRQLRHQQAARADLLQIWRYTNQGWSRSQADDYLTDIDLVLQEIAAGRVKGTRYGEHHLRRRFKAHVIFYRETEQEIIVVRVLHGRMDADRHLPD